MNTEQVRGQQGGATRGKMGEVTEESEERLGGLRRVRGGDWAALGDIMPIFLIFIIFNNHSRSAIIHSLILRQSPRPVFLYPHLISAQQEKHPWCAKPRIELGPALQQADALPSELRRAV